MLCVFDVVCGGAADQQRANRHFNSVVFGFVVFSAVSMFTEHCSVFSVVLYLILCVVVLA